MTVNTIKNECEKKYLEGIAYYENKELYLANRCFLDCLVLDPDGELGNFGRFLVCIVSKQFESSLIYFRKMYTVTTTRRKEYNGYLFLLSHIIDLPEDLSIMAKSLTVNCLNSSFPGVPEKDGLTFPFVLGNNEFMLGYAALKLATRTTIEIRLLKQLCVEAYKCSSQNEQIMLGLLERGDLLGIINFFHVLDRQYIIGEAEHLTLYLVENCFRLERGKALPINQVPGLKFYRDLVRLHAFEDALYEIEIFLSNEKRRKSTCIELQHRLLERIVHTIKSRGLVIEWKAKVGEVYGQKMVLAVSDTLASVYNMLKSGHRENALAKLHLFLEGIGALERESFIRDLIDICMFEGDLSFYAFIQVCADLEHGRFSIDMPSYVENMKTAIREGKTKLARAYLQAISHSGKVTEESMKALEELFSLLDTTKPYTIRPI